LITRQRSASYPLSRKDTKHSSLRFAVLWRFITSYFFASYNEVQVKLPFGDEQERVLSHAYKLDPYEFDTPPSVDIIDLI